MTQVKTCSRCGKILQSNVFYDTCTDCAEAYEKTFEKIRQYLLAHPYASIYEVATNLDISVSTIKKYLKEGRLEIVDRNNTFLTCEKCGAFIQSGKYCNSCASEAAHNYKGIYGRPGSKAAVKFNYLSRRTAGM